MKEQTMEAGTTGPVTVGAFSASAVVTALAGTLIALGSIGTWGRIEGSEQSDAILSGTVGGLALAEGFRQHVAPPFPKDNILVELLRARQMPNPVF